MRSGGMGMLGFRGSGVDDLMRRSRGTVERHAKIGQGEREKRRRGVWLYRNSDLAIDARNKARSIGFQKRKSFRLRDWRADTITG